MKKIYIILTHTGTILSQIIKCWTKDEFSHISIALDADLEEMYSFGRLNPYNPFWGSFVHEYINKGTFKRFKNTTAEVYSMFVTDEQYEKAKKTIAYFEYNKQKYKFNVLGLACVSINKRITRKNTFYCAEFVKHILKVSGITEVNKLPTIIRPENFKQLDGIRLEYEGLLRKYKKKKCLRLEEVQKLIQPNKISFV
jgi:hypothetical protein